VPAALAGGAEIVDAKDPSRGSLGPVATAMLSAIVRAVPAELALSIALGDPGDAAAAAAAAGVALHAVGQRAGPVYVKVGLAGVRDRSAVRCLIGGAVAAAAASPCRASVVAVAYADHEAAGAPARDVVSGAAGDAGAAGVLLDTWSKDGRDLFAHVGSEPLLDWIEGSKRLGILVALAGSLDVAGVSLAARLPADVVGVRGAACAGGRAGRLEASRVRALRRALTQRPALTGRR
jgi:uncharacterized protein (UPF0264 family)